MLSISKIKLRILTHIIIMGGLFLFQFLPLVWCFTFPFQYWLKQSIFFLLYTGIFYGNLYVFVPRLLNNHRTIYFIAVMIVISGGIVLANHGLDNSLEIKARLIQHFQLKEAAMGRDSDLISDALVLIINLLLISCSTIMGVAAKMQKDDAYRKDLESDKVSAELSFLKQQINPHFLFNTLNSIFVLTANNEKAHNAVYNLSRMLRYVLYETGEGYTTIGKEILFLREYLSLMQLRLADNIQVNLHVPDNLIDKKIAAMLFLPLVENAFKHGISGTEACIISFTFLQTEGEIMFSCENSIFPLQRANDQETRGIGLANTRRRLALLYPGQHTLTATADGHKELFHTVLKIRV
jgi:two-component system, LytTR family, sensor kinase